MPPTGTDTMTTTLAAPSPSAATTALRAAIDTACARIAPAWPLDRLIAVNPYWGWVDRPIAEASAEVGALAGAPMLMPRAWYRARWQAGDISARHVLRALELTGAPITIDQVTAALDEPAPTLPAHPLVTALRDALHDVTHEATWHDLVLAQLGRAGEAFFGDATAAWRAPSHGSYFAAWRAVARADLAPRLLLGTRGLAAAIDELPDTPLEVIAETLDTLALPEAARARYLTALLLSVPGWAAVCSGKRWEARLAGGDDDSIVDLLAARAAWELLLYRTAEGSDLPMRWTRARRDWEARAALVIEDQRADWVLQRAVELRWQERLARALVSQPTAVPLSFGAQAPATVRAQTVFCIDVRSEPLRLALETVDPDVRTLGFAGFFGLPVRHEGSDGAARALLPGLLAPGYVARDGVRTRDEGARRAGRRDTLRALWRTLTEQPPAAFAGVETLGLGATVAMLRDELARGTGTGATTVPSELPELVHGTDGRPLDDVAFADLAEASLRGMSLTEGFAPLVAFVGHGAGVTNNPQAAGLACGACGGQAGDVNARLLAALLNMPAVRARLAERGIMIPEGTAFVGALHDTVSDDVTLLPSPAVAASHDQELAALRRAFDEAGAWTRAQRGAALGLAGDDAGLAAALRDRGADWSEVRPEWGLAGNAAFIAAPRERTRAMTLRGRAFLHEYRWERDAGFATLETILTAPMVVAHWINLQYYASTVDPERFGSGDKTLHNVVGGGIGLYEGAGGDVRQGLARQSLHDGARWMHEPLRLAVFIEAPQAAIDAVLAKHATVRALVEHEWVLLHRIDGATRTVHLRGRDGWSRVPSSARAS